MLKNELIVEDWLTAEGLKTYRRNVENYILLSEKREKIISVLSDVSSIDLSQDKVTNGTKKHISRQEILSIRLEDINAELKVFETFFNRIKPELISHINHLPNTEAQMALKLFYLKAKNQNYCTMYIFGSEKDLTDSWDEYIQKFKTLKRCALRQFERLAKFREIKGEKNGLCNTHL